ncbi:MAG TPA: DUF1571 domain-containing protein [Gemmataceae bacterium]|nr:DUF1571 domain-containing protein [Gemmataceae bacterium]
MGYKVVLLGILLLSPLVFYPLLRSSTPPPCHIPVDGQSREVQQEEKLTNAELAERKPIEFLEFCLAEYDKKVTTGYRCHFLKQERVKGKLRDSEKLLVNFRAKPFSVHMYWLDGADLCQASLYVEGENDGRLLARSMLFGIPGPVVSRPLDAADVKATSRFPISEFGMKAGMESTLASMKKAKEKGTLHVRYEGIEKLAKVGDRPCYKLVRTPYDPPEEDNIMTLTIWIDCDLLMQVGSDLRDANGDLIAEYYFRDIELNPKFSEKQFTRDAL